MSDSNYHRALPRVNFDGLQGAGGRAHLTPDAPTRASVPGATSTGMDYLQQEPADFVPASVAWHMPHGVQYSAFVYRDQRCAGLALQHPRLGRARPLDFTPVPSAPLPMVATASSLSNASTKGDYQSNGTSDVNGLDRVLTSSFNGNLDLGRRLSIGLGVGPARFGAVAIPSALVHCRSFAPSTMKQEADGLIPYRPAPPSGTKYQGDPNSFSFLRQVQNLPNYENCSLWITGIATTVTSRIMFNNIDTGAVVALHFSPPKDAHRDQAAKIVFKVPEAAAKFLSKCRSADGVRIEGQNIKAVYNNQGCRRHPFPSQSRVLLVTGPTDLMTKDFWNSYFRRWSKFNWDFLIHSDFPTPPGTQQMVFAFERIDGQAQTCLSALLHDEQLAGLVQVNYGPDPCDSVEIEAWSNSCRAARELLKHAEQGGAGQLQGE